MRRRMELTDDENGDLLVSGKRCRPVERLILQRDDGMLLVFGENPDGRITHMMVQQSVYERLDGALSDLHDGTLDPRWAHAMAAVASTMVRVLTAGEIEERLRRLEDQGRGSD